MDRFENSAHRDGGIHVCRQHNVGEHGGGSGLSVGAGYGDGGAVVLHNLPQKLSPGQHGDAGFFCSGKLRVVRVNGCGINHHVQGRMNVGCALSVYNPGAFALQPSGQIGFFRVRSGNLKAFF